MLDKLRAHLIKPFLLLLLLAPIMLATVQASAAGSAVDRGLVVSGTVVDVKTTCIEGRPAVEIYLFMQFRNDGKETLLLVSPFYYFDRRVHFGKREFENATDKTTSGEVLTYNPFLDNPFGKATADDYDPIPGYVRSLETQLSPNGSTITIEAGRYYEFRDLVRVRNGFRFIESPGNKEKECETDKIKASPEYPYFTLEYHLSLKKYDKGNDLLRTLQTRWEKYGHLLLNPIGDISYRSDKIAFPDDK